MLTPRGGKRKEQKTSLPPEERASDPPEFLAWPYGGRTNLNHFSKKNLIWLELRNKQPPPSLWDLFPSEDGCSNSLEKGLKGLERSSHLIFTASNDLKGWRALKKYDCFTVGRFLSQYFSNPSHYHDTRWYRLVIILSVAYCIMVSSSVDECTVLLDRLLQCGVIWPWAIIILLNYLNYLNIYYFMNHWELLICLVCSPYTTKCSRHFCTTTSTMDTIHPDPSLVPWDVKRFCNLLFMCLHFKPSMTRPREKFSSKGEPKRCRWL